MSSAVSVIIPTRDRGRLLAEAVRSALELPQPPLEVIVVDAGSTDGSVDALAEFGDAVRASAAAQRRRRAQRRRGGRDGRVPRLPRLGRPAARRARRRASSTRSTPTPDARARPRHDRGDRRARRAAARADGARSARRSRTRQQLGTSYAALAGLLRDVHVGDADPARARSRASAASTSRSTRTRTGISTCGSRSTGASATRTASPRSTASGRGTSAGGGRPSGRFASPRSTSPRCPTSRRRSATRALRLPAPALRRRITCSSSGAPRGGRALAAVRLAPRRALRDGDVRRPLVRSFLPARILQRAGRSAGVRVLFNLLDAGVGGGQQVALDIASELVRRGHSVGVVVPAPGPATSGSPSSARATHTAHLVSLRRPGVIARCAHRAPRTTSSTPTRRCPARSSAGSPRRSPAAARRSPARLSALQPDAVGSARSSTSSTGTSSGGRAPSPWRKARRRLDGRGRGSRATGSR